MSSTKTRPERRHNLDKHADQIADQHSAADDDELLDTLATASWLGVSTQFLEFLEIGRVEGYGPPFKRISSRCVKYMRGDARAWLKSRTPRITSEYTRPRKTA